MFSQLAKVLSGTVVSVVLFMNVSKLCAAEFIMENTLEVRKSKAKKVLVTDHPEYFKAQFHDQRCFLPVTQLYTSYMQNLSPVFEYKDIRELIGYQKPGNWKFIIMSDLQGMVGLHAGEKYSFGELAEIKTVDKEDKAQSSLVSPESQETVSTSYRGLHHPTLASSRESGFGKVITAGVFRYDDSLKSIVIDVDSGNYGLDKDSISAEQRTEHLAKIALLFEKNGIPTQRILHDFEGKFVEGLALYPGKEVIARMVIFDLLSKLF